MHVYSFGKIVKEKVLLNDHCPARQVYEVLGLAIRVFHRIARPDVKFLQEYSTRHKNHDYVHFLLSDYDDIEAS